jgi:uncharacterized protein (DUF885 family)
MTRSFVFSVFSAAALGAMALPSDLPAAAVGRAAVVGVAGVVQPARAGAARDARIVADFDSLAARFWRWRRDQQPTTADDIPRYERDTAWVPHWAPADIKVARAQQRAFLATWRTVDTTGWSVARQVDYRLIGSAIQRVAWELDGLRLPERDARFWVQQTLGSVHDAVLPPPPFDAVRARVIRRRLERIPLTVAHAKVGLTDGARPFAELAIASLDDADARLATMARELAPLLPPAEAPGVTAAAATAGRALMDLRAWLVARAPGMHSRVAAGPAAYRWFLREVALVPYTPDELLAMGRQEWARAVAGEVTERTRNLGTPELPMFANAAEQVAREASDERAVRAMLESRGLLTVPSTLRHYLNRKIPAYLAPIADMAVNVDHTSEARLDQDGVAGIDEPGPNLGYFGRAIARDPRSIIVHEGVPGHFMQLTMGWRHPVPMRRRYYDSGPSEGIGFYAEEMMLTAGLFDDRPRVREVLWNFMRLRALRVEVDVRLATGDMTVADGYRYLRARVPMDSGTAIQEAASFAGGPGQAITYTIGKLQITRLLAERREQLGDKFVLRDFHDFVWQNGNVPIALLRWELTGAVDEVKRLGPSGGMPPRVR